MGLNKHMVSYFDCGDELRSKIAKLVESLRTILAGELTGVYLHGSLAMGCFNPGTSDIDLLAAVQGGIAPAKRRETAACLLAASGDEHPLEISFIEETVLAAAQYPLTYQLHYSEAWRSRYIERFSDTGWEIWHNRQLSDPDLAAHIRVLKSRGIKLYGKEIDEVFPDVSDAEYIKAIQYDCEAATQNIAGKPVYYILNLCRFYGFLVTGAVLSKREAGLLVRDSLGEDAAATVDKALQGYTGTAQALLFTESELRSTRAELTDRINKYLCGRETYCVKDSG